VGDSSEALQQSHANVEQHALVEMVLKQTEVFAESWTTTPNS
jgi:hypothetical protein